MPKEKSVPAIIQSNLPKGLKKSIREQHQAEIHEILRQTELPIIEHFSDQKLDRQNEIIELLGGRKTSISELKKLNESISQKVRAYGVKFVQEFYRQIFRLNGWTIPSNGKIINKPPVVANMTIQVIYGRFYREVFPELQQLNPYFIEGIRKYKYFQFLTDEGLLKLENYISQAIEMMKTCDNWYNFRVRYSAKYGSPFQLSIFEDNDGILNSGN